MVYVQNTFMGFQIHITVVIKLDTINLPSMVYVQNTFMGFQIPITVGIKLNAINVILAFHMMNCTSKFT